MTPGLIAGMALVLLFLGVAVLVAIWSSSPIAAPLSSLAVTSSSVATAVFAWKLHSVEAARNTTSLRIRQTDCWTEPIFFEGHLRVQVVVENTGLRDTALSSGTIILEKPDGRSSHESILRDARRTEDRSLLIRSGERRQFELLLQAAGAGLSMLEWHHIPILIEIAPVLGKPISARAPVQIQS